ncbi:MAG: hypothetical protein V1792_15610 [Pseudomonadota bacterium]
MDAFTMESIPVSLQDVMNEPKSKPTNRLTLTPTGTGPGDRTTKSPGDPKITGAWFSCVRQTGRVVDY